jgi:hypothetical protein
MSDQVAKWQSVLDKAFPDGAIAVWERPDSPTYQVLRIEVTGMAGLDPVVSLPVFGPEKLIGPTRLLAYAVLQRTPVLEARATLENMDSMLWSAGVGPHLARSMRDERRELVTTAPHGGAAVLTGEPG